MYKLIRLAAVLIIAAVLAGCRYDQAVVDLDGPQPSTFVSTLVQPSVLPISQPTVDPKVQFTVQPSVQGLITKPLISSGLNLLAGPVDVPLELRIPSLHVNASVLGVGITKQNVMDAPTGPLNDPVWQKVFWYRGSGIPGESGTATFAGHVDDRRGRPTVFAHLMDLRLGDLIVVHDIRNGLDINFSVMSITIYSRQQAVDPSILAQVYGPGPVAGKGPQPALDGLSHVTLITCTGDFVDGSFDRRLVVYATRSN